MSDPLPPDIPAEAVTFLQEMGWMDEDRLAEGDPAPDAPLFTPDGQRRHAAELWAERPVVFIFGSYT